VPPPRLAVIEQPMECRMAVFPDSTELVVFVTFSAVVAGTPGPGNTLLTSVGATRGIRRGLTALFGQVSGMGAMLFAVTLGLGSALLAHPLILEVLKWAGTAMLCWMAWQIATGKPAGHATGRPTGFLAMAAFQWANPKGWLVSTAAVAAFLGRHAGDALGQAVVFAALFSLTALPSCFPWLAFGAALQRCTRTPRAQRVVNITMAALLAVSVIAFTWFRL
jgi:threonine/homoserine/homoserine lactone efflux protein